MTGPVKIWFDAGRRQTYQIFGIAALFDDREMVSRHRKQEG